MPHFLHQRFTERVDGCFRGAVRRAAGKGVLAGQAADIDDPATAAPLHVRNRGVAAVEHAAHVGIDDVVPRRHVHVGDVAEDADAGVVHENVESAEAARRFVNGRFRRAGVLDVGGECMNPFRT